MNALDTAKFLGYNKIVWIDDHFNTTSKEVADLIINNFETSLNYIFDDSRINEILASYAALKDLDSDEVFLESFQNDLMDFLESKSTHDLLEIKNIVLEQETLLNSEHQKELSPNIINKVCDILDIDETNRLNFNNAYHFISNIPDDKDILYMIDLSEGENNPLKGLEILLHLVRKKSKGTAFILSYNVTKKTEAVYENEYSEREEFKDNIVFSVIAKEKLYDEFSLDNSLKSALKKVTLRKNLVDILNKIGPYLNNVYSETHRMLLELRPEDIDKYIFEKGETEGVSELHVIERAIISNTKFNIKKFFNLGKHQTTLEKLRQLKHIPIELNDDFKIHPNLEFFRKLEIFNDKDLVNKNFSPLSCGDIFEVDIHGKKEKFVLLAQPCDIALRGVDGNRVLKEAIFAPLRTKNIQLINFNLNDEKIPKFIQRDPLNSSDIYDAYELIYKQLKLTKSENLKISKSLEKALERNYNLEKRYVALKEMKLDFLIDNTQYFVNFSNAVNINLEVLDVVSFNDHGLLNFNSSQIYNHQFTVALQKKFENQRIIFDNHFKLLEGLKGKNRKFYLESNKTLQLSLFLDILPNFKVRSKKYNISWPVQRIGNIAEPYASEILKKYMHVMSRTAYELDYTA